MNYYNREYNCSEGLAKIQAQLANGVRHRQPKLGGFIREMYSMRNAISLQNYM